MTLRTSGIALFAVASLALTGCSVTGDDQDASDAPSSASADGSGSAGSGDQQDSELDDAAEEAGVDPSNPPEPIASVTMPANIDDATLTVDLISLKREGDLMVLTTAVTPDKKSDADADDYYSWTGSSSPQIVDTSNLKVHDVVETSDGTEVMTNPVSARFGPGQTFYSYAVFAAPPKDVDTVTVKAVDGAPAFTGVEIQ